MKMSNRLQVTYDRHGTIRSVYCVPEPRDGWVLRTGVILEGPEALFATEVELPAHYTQDDLPRLFDELRIDVAAEVPHLIARERSA